ncbi:hypothetical protein C7271_12090 [filamentous cyanobacterium CCP5]|nr:hypothetical protein C7271_12090 [filamentous cyanobacterium CCP5]
MQDFETAPPPQGSNVWKWVAIGCGGCLGLSLLLIVVLSIFISRTLNLSMEPDQVESEAEALFDYDIPGGSEGILTMNIFGIELIQVTDTQKPPQVLLTMGQIPRYLQVDAAQEAFIEGIQEGIAEEEGYQLRDVQTESATLCGQSVERIVETGELNRQGEAIAAISYLSSVRVEGRDRFVWIVANGPEAESLAQSVFDSLECP